MNIVAISGRITQDIVLKYTQNKNAYLNFNVAVRNNDEETYFINCIAWQHNAEFINKYFSKGQGILIKGKLVTENYQTASGENRITTKILVEGIDFPPSNNNPTERPSDLKERTKNNRFKNNEVEDDFPF